MERTFQLLACHVTVRTDCKHAARELDFVVQDARQDFPISHKLVYEVSRRDKQYLIVKDGEPCESGLDLGRLAYRLQWHIHGQVFDVIGECTRIHSGCGEHNGNRFLVVGDSGVGKTTLMTRLLYEGFRVDGDELVMIREGKTIPFPRRFNIKEGSLGLLPQIKPLISDLPFVETGGNSRIFAFSPSEAGFHWQIESREVSLLFYVESNHGGQTSIEKCPKYLMAQKVMPFTFFSTSRDHLKIGEVSQIVDRAQCFLLHMGSLDATVTALREKMTVR